MMAEETSTEKLEPGRRRLTWLSGIIGAILVAGLGLWHESISAQVCEDWIANRRDSFRLQPRAPAR